MTNLGIAPVDTTTDIGKMRVKIRDVTSVPLSPVVAGFGDYTNYSDVELQVFLDDGVTLTRSLGYFYRDLAAQSALIAIDIADHDLKINQSVRTKALQAVADSYFADADTEGALLGLGDIFDSFEFGGTNGPTYPIVEGVDYPVSEYDLLGYPSYLGY